MLVLELFGYALLTAFIVHYGVRVLDIALDYPSPLWKVRYHLANIYGRDRTILVGEQQSPVADYLRGALRLAQHSPLAEKGAVMEQAYNEVGRIAPAFKRYICPFCLSIWIGGWVTLLVFLFLVYLHGGWAIVYLVAVHPCIGAFAKL
ncbi:hypothetical protein LEM8419_03544 [Neolewinella maritima]|uniref:Uncharacterized protein n=1 Tax=Neolewinella maritima TaxID=1383882 RepID=A0ABN8FE51_9BACT|nr:hypothetical protein [Neolewinella maritima]CAH1002672.1 hypothetical protein LEM8419_03544 [Neolewinella maritima]